MPDQSASGFSGKSDETTTFSFTNYHTPSTIFELSLESGDVAPIVSLWQILKSESMSLNRSSTPSKDGTQVPMIVTKKKGLPADNSSNNVVWVWWIRYQPDTEFFQHYGVLNEAGAHST